MSSDHESQTDTTELGSVVDSVPKSNMLLKDRPTDMKAVKEVQRTNKMFKNVANRHVKATEAVADA